MRVARLMTVLAANSLAASPAHAQLAKSKAPTGNEHFVERRFEAKDGTTIDYWVMSPAKIEEGREYPLVLALHGRGGSTTAATDLGSDAFRERSAQSVAEIIRSPIGTV